MSSDKADMLNFVPDYLRGGKLKGAVAGRGYSAAMKCWANASLLVSSRCTKALKKSSMCSISTRTHRRAYAVSSLTSTSISTWSQVSYIKKHQDCTIIVGVISKAFARHNWSDTTLDQSVEKRNENCWNEISRLSVSSLVSTKAEFFRRIMQFHAGFGCGKSHDVNQNRQQLEQKLCWHFSRFYQFFFWFSGPM